MYISVSDVSILHSVVYIHAPFDFFFAPMFKLLLSVPLPFDLIDSGSGLSEMFGKVATSVPNRRSVVG